MKAGSVQAVRSKKTALAGAALAFAALASPLAALASANAPDSRLIDAARGNNAAAASILLRDRVDVNTREGDGTTALHWAVHRNNGALAGQLLKAGADVNAANDLGVTPLSLACANASGAVVEMLIRAGANVNSARANGETPLMTASWTGSPQVVSQLIERGARVNLADRFHGQTALMWAASERHAAVVRLLVTRGADVRARSTGGFTALLFAARSGDIESARILLRGGADVNEAAGAPGSEPGPNALLVATMRGHLDLARFLLEQGANPNADSGGLTPLHWAAGVWETSLTGVNGIAVDRHDEWRALAGLSVDKGVFVAMLLKHGANPNARLRKMPPDRGGSRGDLERVSLAGATPLVLAASAGDVAMMRLLVEGGADPALGTAGGITPLMAAAGLARIPGESLVTHDQALEAAKLAVELGNDVNAADADGETALHGAAQMRVDAVVQFLVERGAKLDVRNKQGHTPLAYAERILQLQGINSVTERSTTGDLLRTLGAK